MTSQQLLLEGVELMLVGMGLVYVFLALLIYCIRGMAFVLERFVPNESATATVASAPKAAAHAVEPDTLKAIQIAIKQHRARRG